jgi:hypothetical protein
MNTNSSLNYPDQTTLLKQIANLEAEHKDELDHKILFTLGILWRN